MTPFARKLAKEVDEVGGTAYLVGDMCLTNC